MTVKDVIKEISVRWSLMDDESKQPYVERAQRDKIRFESEMRVYKDHKEPKNAHYSHPEEHWDVASNHPKLSPSLHTNIDQAVSTSLIYSIRVSIKLSKQWKLKNIQTQLC